MKRAHKIITKTIITKEGEEETVRENGEDVIKLMTYNKLLLYIPEN